MDTSLLLLGVPPTFSFPLIKDVAYYEVATPVLER